MTTPARATAPTAPTPKFTVAQVADLAKSGITPELGTAAGWYSEADPAKIQSLVGWKWPVKTLGLCLVISYTAADGTPTG